MPGRIAIVTYDFPTVSETFVVDHVVGMARRGWSPVVVCDRVDAPALARLEERSGLPVPVMKVDALRWSPRRLASVLGAARAHPEAIRSEVGRAVIVRSAGLRRPLREAAADVVHAHFGPNGVAASIATSGRVPLVVDFHGTDFTAVPGAMGWELYESSLVHASIVVHSAFAERALSPHFPGRIRRVRIGVDPALFSAERGERWGAPLRLLAVGRLTAQKGHAVAIRALALLRRETPHAGPVLRVVGEGPERGVLEELARAQGVERSVVFAGALPHEAVAAAMREADVLVVPSIVGSDGAEEGFGRVALEGLASGLPVVASATGGLPELIGDAGAIIPPGEPEAIAAVVRRLVAEETPASCAARTRARVAKHDLEGMWDDYAAAAESALGAGRQRAARSNT